ncbi:uncharacterized protein LOC141901040 isoform X4 [Tubulanus polymorphus]|uniref:uncharacterized protein LOC141901040 isoform X4 n=1 Tax=Tubulanus polymorphus TaxID=672921 RepID=UPI003DA21130
MMVSLPDSLLSPIEAESTSNSWLGGESSEESRFQLKILCLLVLLLIANVFAAAFAWSVYGERISDMFLWPNESNEETSEETNPENTTNNDMKDQHLHRE